VYDKVTLYIHTYLYGEYKNSRNKEKIKEIATTFATEKLKLQWEALPRIEILSDELPSQDMPRLYANFDAFVLPTRGEGWGLPIVEAMAMEYVTCPHNTNCNQEYLVLLRTGVDHQTFLRLVTPILCV
jgi:glycosyltransferase involved in cell wall biosynthesis